MESPPQIALCQMVYAWCHHSTWGLLRLEGLFEHLDGNVLEAMMLDAAVNSDVRVPVVASEGFVVNGVIESYGQRLEHCTQVTGTVCGS
jgi:hypothetical protein